MNTQLILFPQNYKGYSFNANVLSEYVVDGINFTNLPTSGLTGSGTAYDVLVNQPPNIVNTWYVSHDPAALSIPTTTTVGPLTLLLLHSAVPPALVAYTASRIYQKLSSLTVGNWYTIRVTVNSTPGGFMGIRAHHGSTYTTIQYQPFSNIQTQAYEIFFNAQTANDIIMVEYFGVAVDLLAIAEISVKETNIDPNEVYTDLLDGQVICDLYEEEDIPLTLSVDDFTNVSEQVKSYSKDFDLPGTKRNNRIFDNMFEITRTIGRSTFNPYAKTKCVLKEDGFILFEGYLRMTDIKEKEGEISYSVNLYSEVVVLKDELKDVTFSDLDFSELDHTYDWDNIVYSWDNNVGLQLTNPLPTSSPAYDPVLGSCCTNVLKYPFIDWNHQLLVGGTANIQATSGYPELQTLGQAFRPCIQLKYLIDKIFEGTSFGYTSAFFNTSYFEALFMDFNWGEGNSPHHFTTTGNSFQFSSAADNYASTTYSEVLFPHVDPTFPWGAIAGFDTATSIFTSTQDNTDYGISYHAKFKFTGATTLTVEWYNSGTGAQIDQAIQTGTAGQTFVYQAYMTTTLVTAGDTLRMRFKSSAVGSLVKQNNDYSGAMIADILGSVTNQFVTTDSLLQTLRGELGQWDFLKGIMTMFNLVSMIDNDDPNNILIEPYANVFVNNTNCAATGGLSLACRNIEHDWTEKVDASEMELKPLTDLNRETIFKFVEDEDDYVATVYNNSTGYLYGSKKFNNWQMDILEGTEEIIAEPFAATVSKALDSSLPNFVVPAIYAMSDDGTTEGFDNLPRIFHNNGIKPVGGAGQTYFVPAQNLVSFENKDEFLQFSHLSSIPTFVSSLDFVFESGQLLVSGPSPAHNLYNLWWAPYFNQLYNSDTRIMTLKVNLTPSDIANFKFYDKVMIKNRSFGVNKIEYKPNELATVEFILLP